MNETLYPIYSSFGTIAVAYVQTDSRHNKKDNEISSCSNQKIVVFNSVIEVLQFVKKCLLVSSDYSFLFPLVLSLRQLHGTI